MIRLLTWPFRSSVRVLEAPLPMMRTEEPA